MVFDDDRRDGPPRQARHRRPPRPERRMVAGVVALAVVAAALSVAITLIGRPTTEPLRTRLPPPVFTLPATPSAAVSVLSTRTGGGSSTNSARPRAARHTTK